MADVITASTNSWAIAPYNPFQGVQRWYRAWRMEHALKALDDRTLKDLGIYRCDIPWIAHTQSQRA